MKRCMADAVMLNEYADSKQRAAICVAQWRKRNMARELDAEIFAAGKWNGMEFTQDDLQAIATAFRELVDVHQVPLKFGHNDDQPMTDGQPALGWVKDIWVQGQKLMARFTDVPDVVAEAIKNKLYRNVSVELDLSVNHKGRQYPWVLSGVALLGADIPAVNTLADLQAYMGRKLDCEKRVAFTAIQNEPTKRTANMNAELQAELDSLKAKNSALKAEVEKLTAKNIAVEQEKLEMKVKFSKLEEQQAERLAEDKKRLLMTKLDTLVKERKLAPAVRDKYMADYDKAEDKETMAFSVEKLIETVSAMPAMFSTGETAYSGAGVEEEDGKSPSEIVATRTREYMAKHGEKSFTAAKRAVLMADRDLAEAYTKGGAA